MRESLDLDAIQARADGLLIDRGNHERKARQ